jgi:hypothetical protein
MTQLDLDAIEALATAARPGPWKVHNRNGEDTQYAPYWVVCSADEKPEDDESSVDLHIGDLETAEFVAASRAAVPALLEEVRELRAKVDRYGTELQHKRDDLLDIRGILSPNGHPRKVPMELVPTVAPAVQWLVDELERLRTENAEHRALVELQWTRTQEASALWQREDPASRAGVLPDLGELLAWLMARADQARADAAAAMLATGNAHLGTAKVEDQLAEVRPVVDAAKDVVSTWRQWQRRVHGSTENPPVIPIKTLAAAVDVLALTPAADAITAIAANEQYPHARCGRVGNHDQHTWGDPKHWCEPCPCDQFCESRDRCDAEATESTARAEAALADLEQSMPEPCQPIGCDNGHHLTGCVFAAVDGEEER